MAKAGGSNQRGQELQTLVQVRCNAAGVPLRQTAGSGNKFRCDSDLSNRWMQVECKFKYSKDGISMPSKADWKKLTGEAKGANRFPILMSCGNLAMEADNVLVTCRLSHLLYLMQGVKNEF